MTRGGSFNVSALLIKMSTVTNWDGNDVKEMIRLVFKGCLRSWFWVGGAWGLRWLMVVHWSSQTEGVVRKELMSSKSRSYIRFAETR